MLRQNRSEGSSTSRSFAKTALLGVRRKTFQFSDEQFARHIFFTEPLFLIPSVQTEVHESGSARGAILFSREPLFLLPSGRDWRSRKQRHWADRRSTQLFRGNHFPSFRWVHGRPVGGNLSPAVLSLALHCKEVAEFRQYRKRARRCSDFFRQHPDTVLAKVPKEMAPLGEMPNPERIKAHQSCAGRVCRDRIIGKYNLAQSAGASLKRSVAFHCGNTVCDHEVDRNGRTDVEDAFVNSAPVQ